MIKQLFFVCIFIALSYADTKYIDKNIIKEKIFIYEIHSWNSAISKAMFKWYPQFDENGDNSIISGDYLKECTGSLYANQDIQKVDLLANPIKSTTFKNILLGEMHGGQGGDSGISIRAESVSLQPIIYAECGYFVLENKEKLPIVFNVSYTTTGVDFRFNIFDRVVVYNPNDTKILRDKLLNSKKYYLEVIFSIEENSNVRYFKGRWFFGDWE